MTQRKLQHLVERDIMQLKVLLKTQIATYSVIDHKEQKTIDHFHDTLQLVRKIERHLQRELKIIDALQKKGEKQHKQKRWNAVRHVLRKELQHFHNHFATGKDLLSSCHHLNARLQHFQHLLRSAGKNPVKAEEIKTIRMFPTVL